MAQTWTEEFEQTPVSERTPEFQAWLDEQNAPFERRMERRAEIRAAIEREREWESHQWQEEAWSE